MILKNSVPPLSLWKKYTTTNQSSIEFIMHRASFKVSTCLPSCYMLAGWHGYARTCLGRLCIVVRAREVIITANCIFGMRKLDHMCRKSDHGSDRSSNPLVLGEWGLWKMIRISPTATKMMDTRWSHLRNTLVCLACDQHYAIANTCDYHMSITALDCHLTNISRKTPLFSVSWP